MTTLLLDCTHGSTKDGFAKACEGLVGHGVFQPADRGASHQHQGSGEGHHHHHHSLGEVREAICASGVTPRAQRCAHGVYDLLAQAEAKAHGVSVDEVHFHEVGSAEAVGFVLRACAAMDALGPQRVLATPVCTGFGHVDCAHGRLSIPAPATANVLEGVPAFAGSEEGELTTPTGAALVVYFAEEFMDEAAAKAQADVTMLCNPGKVS